MAATNNARVLTRQAVGSPGDRDYQAAVDRALSPVERTQVGLVWRVARQKVGLVDLDPLSGSGPVSPPGDLPEASGATDHKRQVNEQGDERQQDAHACKAGKVSVAFPHTPQQELLPGGEPTRSVCPIPNGARLPGGSRESDAKDGVGGLRLWRGGGDVLPAYQQIAV